MKKEKISVRSDYLGQDIILELYDGELNGEPTKLVTHDSLEDVFLNQIPSEYQARCDQTIECCDRDHSIVKCVITDGKGRRVVALGESVPETLTTEIQRNIPTTMAQIRSFDRAVIRYLNLPGKVYSNNEIPVSELSPSSSSIKSEEIQPNYEEELPLEKQEVKEEKKEEPVNNSELGNVTITFGKYRQDPKTISEIAKSDIKWMDYMAKNGKATNPDEESQIEAMKKFLAEKR